ncbi:SDR family oxidoreductase [Paraburkholderia unamae]|uniref:3alpha(Or 20beta)-hydroxysteroid dehydrogenase n=1 Tax=Paraburkholderia unamae TaxID=219649 RepID=A0ABX5KWU4_9BURK|nr:SDR family oxidoreductase [Paraburkholderia unamae]PVX85545.1 3alpha(or 20beta)-hydroxysteroid dehydrogenase [Paraburkholderia unamae]RAR55246.1 3alpha(or 20beta)-hydroxysteroid dehydrogenase [Paraburkholderia unamae]CAG9268070.1 3-alpha-(or 20-beta)-hydroxysteroid dehydrogenase [Paraburkholderia unamae]
MSRRFEGKVAFVSGGARGLGASHARRFVAEGGRVVIGDLLDREGEALVAELGEAARYVHLDVIDEASWQVAREAAEAAFGPLSILVNNAGIQKLGSTLDSSLEDFDAVVKVNLHGTFLGTKTIAPSLIAAGGGSIINVSSIAGMIGLPNTVGYVAAKWAVRGLTKASALELGPHKIRVNSIHPGRIVTELTAGLNSPIRPNQLIREPGQPQDVSNLVAFLASDESRFSTGCEFIVDGGRYVGENDPVA